MNKVTCSLCGTSFPENASQCPICGNIRSTDSLSENTGNRTYTYVKGGRFSKANVKKRNRASGIASEPVVTTEESSKNTKKQGKGLLIVVILLLLAIVSVLGYIAFQLFAPQDFISGILNSSVSLQTNSDKNPAATTTEPLVDTQPLETEFVALCKEITLSHFDIQSKTIGETIQLIANPVPADTTDEVVFSSSDTSVATVSANGTVTIIGEGSAMITVSCGSAKAECSVKCSPVTTESDKTEDNTSNPIALNRKEITFSQDGQTWLLYSGDISASDILWSSDNNDVATIEDGKVTAVGNGDTVVYGVYDEQTVSCIIHCDFSDMGDFGGITEAGGISGSESTTYSLYNPYGYDDDVTLYTGDEFSLRLIDEYGNEISDAQWKSTDESICTYTDGTVEAVGIGTAEIIATYNGNDYSCTVRIIEP